jgi:hypothetical protein
MVSALFQDCFEGRAPYANLLPRDLSRVALVFRGGGEMVANGFEREQIAASFEGYNALFHLLATGWNP